MTAVIRSRDNALLKRIALLSGQSRARREAGLAVAEGWHLIRALCEAPSFGPASLECLALSEAITTDPETIAMQPRLDGVARHVVDARVYEKIGPATGPNAVVALFRIPREGGPATPGSGLTLWLDTVQDPGNVGTLLRTAAAAGVRRVLLGIGCADPWAPKTLRAGMGGQFIVAVDTEVDLVERSARATPQPIGLAADARSSLYDTDLTGDLHVVLGNEGAGIGAALAERLASTMRIPMAPGIESLNVAAAGAIVCFERVRQLEARARG